MKMRSDLDHVEISLANLHAIREEKRLLEEAKAKEKDSMSGIMRALTLTKSASRDINLQSFADESNEGIDLSKIQN